MCLNSRAALMPRRGRDGAEIAPNRHCNSHTLLGAQALERTVDEALANAGMRAEEVDAVGVTVGPGLEVCLRVGCEGAKAIAARHGKPFVGVHHLEAHVLLARLACTPPPLGPRPAGGRARIGGLK